MLDRCFRLKEHGTTVRTELLAGVTTFLTMAYIIFVQPIILTGRASGTPTGMDFGAVTAATCIAASLATAIMALYARYPIAQAPGMGENVFFTVTVIPAAGTMIADEVAHGQLEPGVTSAWQVALGAVFISGLLFLLLTLLGLRRFLLETISPSMRNSIAVGIGLFIALIGMKTAGLIAVSKEGLELNPNFASPDLIVFFIGLLLTAGLLALRVRGAIFWGIVAATLLAVTGQLSLVHAPAEITQSDVVTGSKLMTEFQLAEHVVSTPPDVRPTLWKMDLARAVHWPMIPFVLIFLFMVVFDTLGTLVGVAERAGIIRDDKLPRANQAFLSDALGTVTGAALGTSTVTSFIESTAGVEQGGRTGLTALVVAVLFLAALFFSPVIAMVGSYPPITAPALVVVGAMMMQSVTKIQWSNYAESIPCFLVIAGMPLTGSIADGLALGFIAYPIVKLLGGQARDVKWLMYVMALVLVAYFVFVRSRV